jgi:hypothetical protein
MAVRIFATVTKQNPIYSVNFVGILSCAQCPPPYAYFLAPPLVQSLHSLPNKYAIYLCHHSGYLI